MDISDLILKKNKGIIIANKPSLMSAVRDNTESVSLQEHLEKKFRATCHPINRIDKVVGGICVFSLTRRGVGGVLSNNFEKHYLAIVEGKLEVKEKEVEHYLVKKGSKAFISDESNPKAKKASLILTTKEILENYTVVYVELKTGRFHQIRAQLAALGHAIKGDVKYGARRKNKDRSIYLHSYKIVLGDEEYISHPSKEDTLWAIALKNVD